MLFLGTLRSDTLTRGFSDFTNIAVFSNFLVPTAKGLCQTVRVSVFHGFFLSSLIQKEKGKRQKA